MVYWTVADVQVVQFTIQRCVVILEGHLVVLVRRRSGVVVVAEQLWRVQIEWHVHVLGSLH